MTSQRVLLSVNDGMRLHSCIALVDFTSCCDLVLLCYEEMCKSMLLIFDILHGYIVVITYICFTYWDSRVILSVHCGCVLILLLLLSLLSTGHLLAAIDIPRLEDQ